MSDSADARGESRVKRIDRNVFILGAALLAALVLLCIVLLPIVAVMFGPD
jgi:hypothetical protein